MAEKYEKYKVKKREPLKLPTPEVQKEPTTYEPAKQVEGYERRLEASGIDPEAATDDRSFLEKAFNLTEDQNFLFDVFEIIGRPQQAIFNGIRALQEGKSFGEGFKSGLTGENFVQFSEILNEAGFGEEDAFGVDDVIGFLGDVFLDPADLAILAVGTAAAPVTGGTSLVGAGAAVAGANAAVDATKLTQRVMDVLGKTAVKSKDELVKSIKNIGQKIKSTTKTTARFYGDLGQNIVKGEGKDIARKLFSRKTIELSNGQTIRKIGMNDMTMQAFGQLLKKGGKAVNWTVRTGVIETFTKNAETYQAAWDNWLTSMKGHFNAAARLGDKLFIEAQMAMNKASFGTLFGDAWVRKVNNKITDIVEDTFKKQYPTGLLPDGQDVATVKAAMREEILKDLSQYAEHALETSTTTSEILNNPNKYELPIDDKVRERLVRDINHPAYREVKEIITNSATSKAVYERQVRRLGAQYVTAQEGVIDNLKAQRQSLQGQPEKLARLEEKIARAEIRLNDIKQTQYSQRGYNKLKNQIENGIQNGTLDENTFRPLLSETNKAIDEDSYNIFEELFEKTVVPETGQIVYVLRKNAQTEEIIKGINARNARLRNLIGDDKLNDLKTLRRFASGSELESSVRRFLRKSGMQKQFDDIFELKNGMYRIVDEDGFNEIIGLSRPFQEAFEGSRFLTDDEIANLANRFQDGFDNQAAYDSILNDMESAMRWYDKQYETKIKQDTPGYLRHAMTQDAKDMLGIKKVYERQFGNQFLDDGQGVLLGDTRVFKARKYDMSIQEANRISRFNAQRILQMNESAATKFLTADEVAMLQDRATMNLFSEYFTDSMADTLIKMNEYGSAINVMNKSLVAGSLSGKDVLRFGADSASVPRGFQAVPKEQLRNKLRKMTMVMDNPADMEKVIENILQSDGAFAYIDENVYKMIGRLGNEKEVKILGKLMETMNKQFKRLKVFSLGFHFKNLIGNASNLYLAGENPLSIGRMLVDGITSRRNAIRLKDVFAEVAADPAELARLAPDQRELYEAYQLFLKAGFEDAGKMINDLDDLIDKMGDYHLSTKQMAKRSVKELREGNTAGALKDAFNAGLQANVDLNAVVDGGYRLGYIKKLKKQKLSDAEIIQKVKLALFDPSSLTAAEETYKKYIPFYTFAKKNLAFQIKNVFENPTQYNRFIKGVRSSWEAFGVDWENDLQGYQKDNLWLPIPFTMKDGKYMQFKTSFPLSDLGEYLENPSRKIFASLSPLLRAPIEATMNQQFFTGQPIERFEGERGRITGAPAQIDYALSQTGLDRPITAIKSVIDVLANREGASIAPTVFSESSVEQGQRSQAYDRLNELRDLFKYYKQENIPILTIAEIENINKPQATLSQRLAAIQRARRR